MLDQKHCSVSEQPAVMCHKVLNLQWRVETKGAINRPDCFPGRGSCLTVDGQIEMDASVMDGSTLEAGGVVCVTNVANPVSLSRLVMEKVKTL